MYTLDDVITNLKLNIFIITQIFFLPYNLITFSEILND